MAVTILKKLGIEAYPAYVDTVTKKSIIELLPSVSAFNHVIVVAYIEGSTYWIDATHTFQRGSLKKYVQPDYGYALILNAKTTALTKMPTPSLSTPSKEILEEFDLRQDRQAPVKFSVKTIYKKSVADNFREYAHTTAQKEIHKSSLEYYREIYPLIQSIKEIVIKDDTDLNQITFMEEYEIPQAWERDKNNKKWTFNYYARELTPYLRDNGYLQRTMPVALPYPVNIQKKIVIRLPSEEWNLSPEDYDITGPGFSYQVKENFKSNTFSIVHTFKTLKDHVNPNEIDSYIKDIKRARDIMDWRLFDSDYQPTMPKDYINWPIILLLVLATLVFIFAACKLYYYQFKQPLPPLEHTPYKGIGGWLIIIGLQIFIVILIIIAALYADLEIIHSLNQWTLLTDPTSTDFHPLRTLLIVIEAIINVFFLVLFCFLFTLFFKHKRLFIHFYIIATLGFIVTVPTFNILTTFTLNNYFTQEELTSGIAAFLKSTVWVWYILKSERVRATFVKE